MVYFALMRYEHGVGAGNNCYAQFRPVLPGGKLIRNSSRYLDDQIFTEAIRNTELEVFSEILSSQCSCCIHHKTKCLPYLIFGKWLGELLCYYFWNTARGIRLF